MKLWWLATGWEDEVEEWWAARRWTDGVTLENVGHNKGETTKGLDRSEKTHEVAGNGARRCGEGWEVER